MTRKQKETPHLRLRIEPRLLDRLEKARARDGRTLTGEIVHRLEQSFRREGALEDEKRWREALRGVLGEELQKRETALGRAARKYQEKHVVMGLLTHVLDPEFKALLEKELAAENSTQPISTFTKEDSK
jgi:hypothetical protein